MAKKSARNNFAFIDSQNFFVSNQPSLFKKQQKTGSRPGNRDTSSVSKITKKVKNKRK